MHQAVTTVIVCFCLALAPAAQAGDGASEAAGTIARARRLIDAKDYASATMLLEDLLLEAKPKERATILGILRQSYEVMAKEAEAAGRDREAAHYRDNLAILAASKLAPEPAVPAGPAKPRTQAPPRPKSTAEKIVAAAEKVRDQALSADLTTLISAPTQDSIAPAGRARGSRGAGRCAQTRTRPRSAPGFTLESPFCRQPGFGAGNTRVRPG